MYVGTTYSPILNAFFQSSRLECGNTSMNSGVVAYFKRQSGNCLTNENLGKGSQCFDRN
jgi:hypothetical protein